MNDQYGDPRNYDPNVDGYNPYEDPNVWGPTPSADPYAPAAAPNTGYAPWTDPDTPAPDFLTNPNQRPAGNPGDGNYWDWDGTKWVIRAAPRANPGPTTTRSGGDIAPPPSGDYDDPYHPMTTGGAIDIGRAPGSLLPYPGYESPGAFEFDPFLPSSWEDAEKEPGFEQSQNRLSKQVQNSAAYQGVLRSGMTIGKLDSVLDSNRQQNFAQFDARRYRNWEGNTGMKLAAFDRRATDFDRKNNYNFNVADRSFADELARWQEQVRSLTSLAKPT